MLRKTAYELVQRAAMSAWKSAEAASFQDLLKRDPKVRKFLSIADIDRLCDLKIHFKHVDETFRKLGL
jgi:adenylosuccinate lyase